MNIPVTSQSREIYAVSYVGLDAIERLQKAHAIEAQFSNLFCAGRAIQDIRIVGDVTTFVVLKRVEVHYV